MVQQPRPEISTLLLLLVLLPLSASTCHRLCLSSCAIGFDRAYYPRSPQNFAPSSCGYSITGPDSLLPEGHFPYRLASPLAL
jgi:hypothetical protein